MFLGIERQNGEGSIRRSAGAARRAKAKRSIRGLAGDHIIAARVISRTPFVVASGPISRTQKVKRVIDLHFICPQGRNHAKLGPDTYESGNWTVSDERADEAVGGRIYLHDTKKGRSWHGGTIQGWACLRRYSEGFHLQGRGRHPRAVP